jgi:hypothetical protein
MTLLPLPRRCRSIPPSIEEKQSTRPSVGRKHSVHPPSTPYVSLRTCQRCFQPCDSIRWCHTEGHRQHAMRKTTRPRMQLLPKQLRKTDTRDYILLTKALPRKGRSRFLFHRGHPLRSRARGIHHCLNHCRRYWCRFAHSAGSYAVSSHLLNDVQHTDRAQSVENAGPPECTAFLKRYSTSVRTCRCLRL